MPFIGAAVVPHGPLLLETVAKGHAAAGQTLRQAATVAGGHFVQLKATDIILLTPHGPASFGQTVPLLQGQPYQGALKDFGELRPSVFSLSQQLTHELQVGGDREHVPTQLVSVEELDYGVVAAWRLIGAPMGIRVLAISTLGLSSETLVRLGQVLREVAVTSSLRVGVIASADFSRRKSPDPRFDRPTPLERDIANALRSRSLSALPPFTSRAVCGLGPIVALLSALEGRAGTTEVLTSAAPYGVGHLVAWLDA